MSAPGRMSRAGMAGCATRRARRRMRAPLVGVRGRARTCVISERPTAQRWRGDGAPCMHRGAASLRPGARLPRRPSPSLARRAIGPTTVASAQPRRPARRRPQGGDDVRCRARSGMRRRRVRRARRGRPFPAPAPAPLQHRFSTQRRSLGPPPRAAAGVDRPRRRGGSPPIVANAVGDEAVRACRRDGLPRTPAVAQTGVQDAHPRRRGCPARGGLPAL